MTTVHLIYTIRSFRSARDRDFLKALQIYDANTPPQSKTDSREIAYWLEQGVKRVDAKFFVCGLYVSGVLVGFVEFIHLKKERLIHFDYFIIEPESRTAGAFHTFAEQMRLFFIEEKLEWDFITAEISQIDKVNGVSRQAQRLIRLFRLVGFYEVLTEYRQPLLGIEQVDTSIEATFLILPRVEINSISRSRFLHIIHAVYFKHYVEWYSIYADTTVDYLVCVEALYANLQKQLGNQDEIPLRCPEREFPEVPLTTARPFQGAFFYLIKIGFSAIAAGIFHYLLKHHATFSRFWIIGISLSAFVLLIVTVSLTDKKRFEAFKLLVALVSKFFEN